MRKVDLMDKFRTRYANDPELAKREAQDANSEYNQELARDLGIAPAAARDVRVLVALTIKKLVERRIGDRSW